MTKITVCLRIFPRSEHYCRCDGLFRRNGIRNRTGVFFFVFIVMLLLFIGVRNLHRISNWKFIFLSYMSLASHMVWAFFFVFPSIMCLVFYPPPSLSSHMPLPRNHPSIRQNNLSTSAWKCAQLNLNRGRRERRRLVFVAILEMAVDVDVPLTSLHSTMYSRAGRRTVDELIKSDRMF